MVWSSNASISQHFLYITICLWCWEDRQCRIRYDIVETKSKQIEHVQFVSTLSKRRNFVRHCCWCGRGFTVSCCEVGDNQPHRDKRCCWLLMINAPDMSSRAAVNDKSGAVSLQSLQSRVYKCLCLRIFLGTVAICSGSTRRCTTTD